MEKSNDEIKNQNFRNRHDLLDKMSMVQYFETTTVKIDLFFCGNNHYIEQAELDLKDIRLAEKTNQRIQSATRTNSLKIENIHEAEVSDFKALLEVKFYEARRDFGFKTKDEFALHEANELELRSSKLFNWFPILEQWVRYLRTGRKIEKFNHSPQTRKANAKKGGEAKLDKGYGRFKEWADQNNVDVLSYQNVSNENFSTAVNDKGFEISAKTAGKYKKKYLSERQNR